MSIDKSVKAGKYEGSVVRDEEPTNPREFSNLGRMVCSHRRYNLGDDVETLGFTFKADNFGGWADVEKYLREEEGAAVILPLYLYDHGDITMSTKPFSCRFDSGQVGFIYATAADINDVLFAPGATQEERVEKARKNLEIEVEIYDNYLRGDVHGWQVVDADGNHVDGCFGYYGDGGRDLAEQEMRRAMEALVNPRRGESETAHFACEC